MRWKRWHHHHRGGSLPQHPDATFRTKILNGGVRSGPRRHDEVRRSQLQGGIRLQEGQFSLATIYFLRILIFPKSGSSTPDLSSSPASSVSQAVNLLYGTSVGKSLLQVTCGPDPNAVHTSKDTQSWKGEVVFTNASYQSKKFIFLLFINRTYASSSRPTA